MIDAGCDILHGQGDMKVNLVDCYSKLVYLPWTNSAYEPVHGASTLVKRNLSNKTWQNCPGQPLSVLSELSIKLRLRIGLQRAGRVSLETPV